MVRGEKVAFSAMEVNSLYWLSTEGIKGSYAMIHASLEEQMEDALRMVVVKGAEWIISPIRCHILQPCDIKKNLVIWRYFVK